VLEGRSWPRRELAMGELDDQRDDDAQQATRMNRLPRSSELDATLGPVRLHAAIPLA
jgi:hypothetical protein